MFSKKQKIKIIFEEYENHCKKKRKVKAMEMLNELLLKIAFIFINKWLYINFWERQKNNFAFPIEPFIYKNRKRNDFKNKLFIIAIPIAYFRLEPEVFFIKQLKEKSHKNKLNEKILNSFG